MKPNQSLPLTPVKFNTAAITCSVLLFLALLHISCLSSIFPATNDYDSSYTKAMNIFFKSSRNSFHPEQFQNTLLELSSIGINTIYVVTFHYSGNSSDNSIYSTTETIGDGTLPDIIRLSKEHGIEPVLKPHIDLEDGTPRYKINPQDMNVWTASYNEVVMRYARISEEHNLRTFIIGTELDNVADSPLFHKLIRDSIRAVYSGKIIYASSFDHFISTDIWNHVDAIGVNTYFNLCRNETSSLNQLVESWNHWLNVLERFSLSKGKNIYITEAGFYSRKGAAINPGDWTRDGEVCFTEQKKGYEALLCQAALFKRIKGIAWWQWELNNSWGNDSADYTPKDKPAQQVIERYWGE